MVNLCQAWAEAFMAKTGTPVAVTGGGSGVGIASLLNGTCDIAAASREMEGKELEQARQKNIQPRKFIVGLDGLAVVVNPRNPVSRLTLDQIADIFTGKITRWDQVGGRKEEIVLLSREVNSGTHVYFKEHVLRRGKKEGTEEFSSEALLLPSSQDIADQIAHNEKAIGYYGMGYLNATQKAIAVAKAPGKPYVEPRVETVLDGSYPISRPLLMYTNGEPTGAVKEFLEFALSEEGQQIVKEQDFVPVPAAVKNP
jgi:phosphate transport system substrate-binding protein